MIGTTSGLTIVREVSPFFIAAGLELERMHPKLYTGIVRQTSAAPGGVLVSDKTAATLLVAIGHELLKSDITWGKVVSVFAVAGGLAVDCVSQGHPEYVHGLMEAITEVLEEDVADWVSTNGGWVRSKSVLLQFLESKVVTVSVVTPSRCYSLNLAVVFLLNLPVRMYQGHSQPS